jgi:tripartite-type tricarboxylate transporter receptor subunit TctC
MHAITRREFMILAGGLAWVSRAPAQGAYPTKPVHLIAPYAPGGPTEILGRLLAVKLQERLGVPFLVESRPGATGNIGTDFVAKSPGDGYTLVMGAAGPLAINVTLYKKLPYDPLKDLAPIILVAAAPLVLVVHPSFPAQSVKELMDVVRAKPDGYSYASAGSGSPQHLSAELFKMMTGLKMVHVPYKGAGPAINDLLGGQVQIDFESMIPILPQIKGRRVRPLAVTSAKRSPLLPDVPTLAEAGVPGYESISWYGVLAPGTTSRDIVLKLNREMGAVLDLPDMKTRLEELGSLPVHGTPEQFRDFIQSETVKWGKVVRESGATVD